MYYYLKKHLKSITLILLIIIVGQVMRVVSAVINANALNELIALNWQGFIFQEVYLMIVWSIIILFDWIFNNYKAKVIQNLDISIRLEIAEKLKNSNYENFHGNFYGTYASWLNNDIQTINKMAFENFFEIAKGISGTILSLVVLFKYHWSLPSVTFLSVLIMLLVPKIFGKKMRQVSLQTTRENEKFLSNIEESLQAYDMLISYNKLELITKRILNASLKLKKFAVRQAKVESTVSAVGFSTNIFFQIFITAFTGFLAFKGIVKIGTIEATGALTGTIFTSLGNLSNQLSAIIGAKPVFEKPFQMITRKRSSDQIKISTLENDKCVFELSNVGFAYENNRIFENLSFGFVPHKKYLIIGASGSGKTTLLKLLAGLYEKYDGSLKFYNNELSKTDKVTLRNQVLYLDQKPFMFSGTVRDNICLTENFTEEEIKQSLRLAGILSDGTDSEIIGFMNKNVGEDGRSISGGQKQRIALARGLI